MVTNQTIKDDNYMAIENEFEQIRVSLGMYIAKLGTAGAYHLIKEIVNNAIDESVNPLAMSTEFDVVFDEVEQSFTVIDYSRGIPFDKMVEVCTKKHTSTKFIRDSEQMKDQAGRNGVGMVVTAACSNYYSMISYRGNQSKTVEIIDGKIKEHKPVNLKKERHGLTVKFVPSSEYLQGEVNMHGHDIQDYFRHISYILKDTIKITYSEFAKDIKPKDYEKKKPTSIIKYKRLGLGENVKYLSQSLQFQPVELFTASPDFDLEMSFSYDPTIEELLIDSYCNYIHTTEGGNHEVVAQRAICDFFCREAKKLDPNAKYEVTFEDCRKGLIFVVNCKHKDPAFEGQHKSRVSNDDILRTGKRMLMDALYKHFNANNALLRKIIAYLRTIAKVRTEAHKIKGKELKKNISFMDENSIPMYYPLANRNSNGYSEIIIAEGDSAAVAVDTARNSSYQAVFGVMGVVPNTHGMTSTQVITKCTVFRNMVNVLGCGIGTTFDIAKLRFSKIIIEADADADGSNITSLILLFFICHLPELVLQGKVYKALPPLYILNEKTAKKWYKGSILLYSRSEYNDVINQIISNNSEIAIEVPGDKNNVVPLKKKEYYRWLKMNTEYTTELDHLEARASSGNLMILEFVCYAYMMSKNDKEFGQMITDQYPELAYNAASETITGSNDGESTSLIVDDIFWNNAKKFMKLLSNNDSLYIHVKNKNDTDGEYTRYTIGEFLYKMEKTYTIDIQQRYKGRQTCSY